MAFVKGQVGYWTGRKRSLETNRKISETKKGGIPWNKGLSGYKANISDEVRLERNKNNSGEKNYRWINDRSLVKVTDREHSNPRYKQWKKAVHTRDNNKCRIANEDCSGRMEAHHILPWSQSPELRYEVNNGIILCHYHHPRKREDEKRLAPAFQEIVLRPVSILASTT